MGCLPWARGQEWGKTFYNSTLSYHHVLPHSTTQELYLMTERFEIHIKDPYGAMAGLTTRASHKSAITLSGHKQVVPRSLTVAYVCDVAATATQVTKNATADREVAVHCAWMRLRLSIGGWGRI